MLNTKIICGTEYPDHFKSGHIYTVQSDSECFYILSDKNLPCVIYFVDPLTNTIKSFCEDSSILFHFNRD